MQSNYTKTNFTFTTFVIGLPIIFIFINTYSYLFEETVLSTKDVNSINSKTVNGHACLNADFAPTHHLSIWTLVTNNHNYVLGAIKLGYSILRHKNISVDMIIMVLETKPLSDADWKILYNVGWKRCVVKRIKPMRERDIHIRRYRDQYTKLQLWRMTSYDTILYLDADTLVVGNINALITTNLKSYSIGVTKGIVFGKWVNTFNMGVFVIHPKKTEFERLIDLKNNSSIKFDSGKSEQGFLNTVYKDQWSDIGFIYNANTEVFKHKKELWTKLEKDIRIIHYTNNKPWKCGKGEILKICEIWKNST